MISNIHPITNGSIIIRNITENILISRDLHQKQKWTLQILNVNATNKIRLKSESQMIAFLSPQILVSDRVDSSLHTSYNIIASAVIHDDFHATKLEDLQGGS